MVGGKEEEKHMEKKNISQITGQDDMRGWPAQGKYKKLMSPGSLDPGLWQLNLKFLSQIYEINYWMTCLWIIFQSKF